MRVAWCGFLAVLLCFMMRLTSATVVLNTISASFPDLPAKYAVSVRSSGVCGALYAADPLDGCFPLRNSVALNRTELQTRFVLIIRGECPFEDKILNAQIAGFRAAIVYDDRDNSNLIYMMLKPDSVAIHALFVSKEAGEVLGKYAKGEDGECCIYQPHDGKAWTVLAISFLSLILMLGFVVMLFFVPRQWAYWYSRNHCPRSVDSKVVETLPCFMFGTAGLSHCRVSETCAICLEDYRDGEIIKILPCQHMFHSSCVDSWLTKWGTCCPVCKLDMRTKAMSS